MPSFNLVDEPWIPCVEVDAAGTPVTREFSLRETLHRAHQLIALAGESPPVTAALYRLLLAVVHRCSGRGDEAGPADMEQWAKLRDARHFDAAAIDHYLDEQRLHFDLFDHERPFFQTAVAAVDDSKRVSMAKLLFQSDHNPLLWDHLFDKSPPSIPAAQAARLVVAFQGFDTGGTVTGSGKEHYADAAPLIQCAVFIVRGANLFETLMLNLHRYSPEDGVPWEFVRAHDRPAWEREGGAKPEECSPDGYLDLLTWQSRRIRLWPEADADGSLMVRRATVMKGFQFPANWPRARCETMVAFVPRLKAQPKADPNPPVGFREDRALWRDSLALFESQGATASRPMIFKWLATLSEDGLIDRSQQFPVDALGLAAARGKLLFWRHERVALPLAYVDDDSEIGGLLRTELRKALELAESVGRLLEGKTIEVPSGRKTKGAPSPMRTLAQELLGARGAVEELAKHLAATPVYWAALEEPFRRFLTRLPYDVKEDDGDVTYGAVEWPRWKEALRAVAKTAFQRATEGLEQTATGLRAVSLAAHELDSRLYQLLGASPEPANTVEAVRR